MPNSAVPLVLAGVSSRRVRLPTMRKSPGSLSATFSGTGSFDASAASWPYEAFLPPGPVTLPFSAFRLLASTFHFAAAADSSISRTCAPATRSFSQPSRTDVEPPVSCGPPRRALPYSLVLGGAITTCTVRTSTLSSSAISIGIDV